MVRRSVAILLFGTTFASTSHAQVDARTAAADALFEEGRKALAAGEVATACGKFEESWTLDKSAMGTLFNLAMCNERRGRYASAVLQFKEVIAGSLVNRSDRAKLAEARVKALEPKLSRLQIVVPPAVQVAGLEVRLDQSLISPAVFGTPLAVDGGEHVIEAVAPGHAALTIKRSIAAERASETVTLEPLRALPPEAPRAETAPPPPPAAVPAPNRALSEAPAARADSSRTTWGWVATGGGVAALALGAGFGIAALQTASDYNESPTGGTARDDAKGSRDTQAWVANIALPVGVVLSAVGIYLLATAPSQPAPTQSSWRPLSRSF